MNEPKPPPEFHAECGASDGFSVCTEPLGHLLSPHWDRRTQHEWPQEDDG